MTAIITFTRQPSGQEIAMLGKVEVGWVAPYPLGRRTTAIWRCSLPFQFQPEKMPSPASDIRNAKRQLLLSIADWHEAAGEPYAARIFDIRQQASDVLREAA